MPEQRIDLPQGTLDLLILRTLALGPQHGWAISERIHQVSSKVLQVQQGSLYPALHRLERRGWIKAHWGASENNRRAKFYDLTPSGRKQLEAEKTEWKKLTAAVAQVLARHKERSAMLSDLQFVFERSSSAPPLSANSTMNCAFISSGRWRNTSSPVCRAMKRCGSLASNLAEWME